MLRLMYLVFSAGLLWVNVASSATQTGSGMNPAPATNQGYQGKESALSAKISNPPGKRANVPAGLEIDQGQKSTQPWQVSSAVVSQSKSRASAPVWGWQSGAANDGVNRLSWRFWCQRWMMFGLVALFLVRRVWRYFHDVGEDDDFADHLASLAVAYRWVFPLYLSLLTLVAVAEFFQVGNFFFSLAVLVLASSLRRYYCEADFADHPTAQKIHLALSLLLVWLGWRLGYDNYLADITTWFHPQILVWVLLALATIGFSGLVNGADLAEVKMLALPFLFIGTAGGFVGCLVWLIYGIAGGPVRGFFVGGIFAGNLLLARLLLTNNPVFVQGVSRIFEMFLPKLFSEKIPRKKRLPPVSLLRHWRDHGDVEKAWQTAKSHLLREERALPVWLFAMETTVLYRRKPNDALELLGQLCLAEEFHYDHRVVATAMMQGWMAAAGFSFDAARFRIERPPLMPSELTDVVDQKCRAGRFGEAEMLLKKMLEKDSLNEPAFVQLVRLYCQDMKNRPAAEKLIAGARETFSAKLLDFLDRSLDEWMRLPIRSLVKRRNFLDWFRRPDPVEPAFKKIAILSPPITSSGVEPEAEDPLAAHLDRVKKSRKKVKDTTGMTDPIEKLLAEERLGSAVEMLQQQSKNQPKNFDLWLRYAEAHGLHCGNLTTARTIIRQMERSGNFRKSQIKKAYTRLKKWHEKHPLRSVGW